MQVGIRKPRDTSIFVVLSILLIIYLTDSLLFATNSNSFFLYLKRFVPIVLALALAIKEKIINKTLLIVCVSIMISMLFSGRALKGYFYYTQVAILVFAYYYSKNVSFEEFADIYIKLLRIIIVVSLVGWLYGDIIRELPFFPTITNTVHNTYKTLFFTNVPLSSSLARRNWGPFWEPGVFQYYINIGILFLIFRKPKYWFVDIIVFVIADLSTLSGASILPLPFLLIAYLFNKKDSHRSGIKLLVACISVIFVFIVFGTGYFDEVINKVLGVDRYSTSMGFRLGSAIGNIRATLMHPLFGASPETQDELRNAYIYQLNGHSSSGNTNTIFGYFAFFGIPVGIYLTTKLYGFTRNFSETKVSRVAIFISILLATSNENLVQSLLLTVLLFLRSDDGYQMKELDI